MTYRLVVDRLAVREIADARRWYQERSPSAAGRFVVELRAAFARIAENPLLYGVRFDEFRQCMVHGFPYSVVYRTLDDRVHVVAIAHSSREPGYWHGSR